MIVCIGIPGARCEELRGRTKIFGVQGNNLHLDGEDGAGKERTDNVTEDIVVQLVLFDPIPDIVRDRAVREGED